MLLVSLEGILYVLLPLSAPPRRNYLCGAQALKKTLNTVASVALELLNLQILIARAVAAVRVNSARMEDVSFSPVPGGDLTKHRAKSDIDCISTHKI